MVITRTQLGAVSISAEETAEWLNDGGSYEDK